MIYDESRERLDLRNGSDTWQWFSSICFAVCRLTLCVCMCESLFPLSVNVCVTYMLPWHVLLCCQVALAAASKTERAVLLLPCESGQYTSGRECCMECPPGEGVVRKCGATQTTCAQCLDSEWRFYCMDITPVCALKGSNWKTVQIKNVSCRQFWSRTRGYHFCTWVISSKKRLEVKVCTYIMT